MSGNVDAHVHVWSLARGDYGWLTADLAAIYRDFSLCELTRCARGPANAKAMLVQAAPTVAETNYLLEVAAKSGGMVRGVVGWADCAAADAVPTLTRLARDPLFKAVRPMLQDLADPAWILRDDVGRTLAVLPRLGLRSRRWSRRRSSGPVADARASSGPGGGRRSLRQARDRKQAPGSPGPRSGARWRPPAPSCKLSGLVTEAGRGGASARCAATLRMCSTVSAQRLIWGSDWPVLKLAATYEEWYAAMVALTGGWTQAERRR